MRRARRAALITALAAVTLGPAAPGRAKPLRFHDLVGWSADDQAAALAAFRKSCPQMERPAWREACDAASQAGDARAFFERYFRLERVGTGRRTLFTGYYEPEIAASPVRTARFAYPIYAKPPELVPGHRWYSRKAIESRGLLKGRGLELAWLADPVEVFFLQIQGSGRLLLPDGTVMRVGFAAKNGQPYRSVGREMARRGLLPASAVSAQSIAHWVRAHPEEGQALLWSNPSFVFFHRLHLPANLGPYGAMHVPVTAGRSLAVDPRYVPLGAPVWVSIGGAHPMHRLMVAQDAGTAIKGPWRADVFIGSGPKAGRIAGRMRDPGRMYVLKPIEVTMAEARE
ncbi:murein transglycosylase A [Solirhodobacter olei]|uniref:murein transglycosylase A n=1 Tax=Solirhodobacter olei TaxID=2493082 RepID=UPI000FD7A8E1|nr:MltA domain-containing protein [Solirhodobacter olei]